MGIWSRIILLHRVINDRIMKKRALLLWFVVAVSAVDADLEGHRSRQREGRLLKSRREKGEDSEHLAAPAIAPSLYPMAIHSDRASVVGSTEPSVAPSTSSNELLLPPSLFASTTTAAPATVPVHLLALVLSAWVDPAVLQTALRTYAGGGRDDPLVTILHIDNSPRAVENGHMLYELAVHNTDRWLNDRVALASYLRYALATKNDKDAGSLYLVRINRAEVEALRGEEQQRSDQVDNVDVDDDSHLLLIVIMVISWSLVCCCLGIAIILIPGLLRYRQELREQWSYNREKEQTWKQGISATDDSDEHEAAAAVRGCRSIS